ncbi:hypothetical protein [Oceanibaculum indicum]|uniref:Uncharacterized protein n=1 Tax=Oceanibaculum indicum P24 TaxID=1207063 RepID=K2JU80_9PROT|nr:hypothetical protein [Oceanibaculum indicum]EKE68715.1 hypothetical protein P24_17277 [Oceanibaculum indicum P24]
MNRDSFLAPVEAYLRRTGLSEAHFGNRAVNDWTFVQRLRAGRVTIRIAERALAWIAEQDAAAQLRAMPVGAGAAENLSHTDNLPPRAAE